MDAGEPPDMPQMKVGFKRMQAKWKFACNLEKGKDQECSTTGINMLMPFCVHEHAPIPIQPLHHINGNCAIKGCLEEDLEI